MTNSGYLLLIENNSVILSLTKSGYLLLTDYFHQQSFLVTDTYECMSRTENACILEIEPTPIFQATRKRVGSVSRQKKKNVYMSNISIIFAYI